MAGDQGEAEEAGAPLSAHREGGSGQLCGFVACPQGSESSASPLGCLGPSPWATPSSGTQKLVPRDRSVAQPHAVSQSCLQAAL